MLYKMFCSNYHIGNDMVSSKKDMFVLINWLCSIVVLFTLPYLFSKHLNGGTCTATEVNGNGTNGMEAVCEEKVNSFGTLLGFSSVSYLVGYFGILLAMKDRDKRGLHVPDTGKTLFSTTYTSKLRIEIS